MQATRSVAPLRTTRANAVASGAALVRRTRCTSHASPQPSHRRMVLLRPAPAASDDGASVQAAAAAPAEKEEEPETVFFEGSGGSTTELALSVVLGVFTLIYMPLTIASIGRRLWLKIKVTNKRIIISNTSPLFKRESAVSFSKIKEVRAAPRAFGAWGDMVIMLKDGSQLELLGMQDYQEIKQHIERYIYTIRS